MSSCVGFVQVAGEASETDSDNDSEQPHHSNTVSAESSQIFKRDLPPLIVVRDHPDIQSVVEDRPSPTHYHHGELQKELF